MLYIEFTSVITESIPKFARHMHTHAHLYFILADRKDHYTLLFDLFIRNFIVDDTLLDLLNI